MIVIGHQVDLAQCLRHPDQGGKAEHHQKRGKGAAKEIAKDYPYPPKRPR